MKLIKYLFLIAAVAMVSCGESDEIKKKLKDHVIENSNGMIKHYKLLSIAIDTVTAGDRVDSLAKELEWAEGSPDIETLTVLRNQEFTVFRASDPDYEAKVMTGELKDASEWCTLIREITEKADSLIAVWPTVKEYNYDYLWLLTWYIGRSENYFEGDDSWEMNKIVESHKEDLMEIERLSAYSPDSIIGYDVIHKYAIKNPLLYNMEVNIKENVFFDTDLNIVRYDTSLE